jgi:hypothetical protein
MGVRSRFTRLPGMKILIPQLIPVLLASLSLNVIAATTSYTYLDAAN